MWNHKRHNNFLNLSNLCNKLENLCNKFCVLLCVKGIWFSLVCQSMKHPNLLQILEICLLIVRHFLSSLTYWKEKSNHIPSKRRFQSNLSREISQGALLKKVFHFIKMRVGYDATLYIYALSPIFELPLVY